MTQVPGLSEACVKRTSAMHKCLAPGWPIQRPCQTRGCTVSNHRSIPHAGLRLCCASSASGRSGVGSGAAGRRLLLRRLNRKRICHGVADLHDASSARSRGSFRSSHAPLEPENGALHLRRPQRHPHHRPRADRADAASGAAGNPRRRRRRRASAARRHQAPGAGADRRGRQALRPVLRQLPLARRHADQLQDDVAVDPPAARIGRADQQRPEPG